MKIREATKDDTPEIARLSAVLGYPAEVEKIRDRVNKIAKSETDRLFICEDSGGEIAGWLQAHSCETLEYGSRVEIIGLVVSEDKRRRGVGRCLVRAAEAWAASRGIASLVVRSNVLREESHIFYPALGFKKNKTQAVYLKRISEIL